MQRTQLSAAVFAALLFSGGAAVGALGHRYYTNNNASTNVARIPDQGRRRYIEEMQDRLKLTPAQLKQLEAILDDTKAQYHAVRDSYKPQILKIKQAHIERVKSILNPEQIPAYEKLVAERDQRGREQEERDRGSQHATQ
jgi:hypothetical protein